MIKAEEVARWIGDVMLDMDYVVEVQLQHKPSNTVYVSVSDGTKVTYKIEVTKFEG